MHVSVYCIRISVGPMCLSMYVLSLSGLLPVLSCVCVCLSVCVFVCVFVCLYEDKLHQCDDYYSQSVNTGTIPPIHLFPANGNSLFWRKYESGCKPCKRDFVVFSAKFQSFNNDHLNSCMNR